jgi:hypothetical protein
MNTPSTTGHLPIEQISARALCDMSPAAILSYDKGDRERIAEGREAAADQRRVELEGMRRAVKALELEVARLERASYVASAIADAERDTMHGRMAGDVILGLGGVEYLVLGVRMRASRLPEYLVIPWAVRNAQSGDAVAAEWQHSSGFSRP